MCSPSTHGFCRICVLHPCPMGSLRGICPGSEVYQFVITGPCLPSREWFYPIKAEPLFAFLEGDSLSFFSFLEVFLPKASPKLFVHSAKCGHIAKKQFFRTKKVIILLCFISPGSLSAEIATSLQHMYHGSLLPMIPWCPWKGFPELQGCSIPLLWGSRWTQLIEKEAGCLKCKSPASSVFQRETSARVMQIVTAMWKCLEQKKEREAIIFIPVVLLLFCRQSCCIKMQLVLFTKPCCSQLCGEMVIILS